jgi:hypothetical protein
MRHRQQKQLSAYARDGIELFAIPKQGQTRQYRKAAPIPPPPTGNNSGNEIGNIAHLPTPHLLSLSQHCRLIENQNSGKNGKQKSGNISGNNSGNISGNIPTSGNASRPPPTPNFSHSDRRRLPTGKNSGNKIGNIDNDSGNISPLSAHHRAPPHPLHPKSKYRQKRQRKFRQYLRQYLRQPPYPHHSPHYRRIFALNRWPPHRPLHSDHISGNISGKNSGNQIGNHHHSLIHHRSPCTSQKRIFDE